MCLWPLARSSVVVDVADQGIVVCSLFRALGSHASHRFFIHLAGAVPVRAVLPVLGCSISIHGFAIGVLRIVEVLSSIEAA